ncbi:hypothetical protein [Streptomyces sp. NPDC091040]|uniref:hypothetical protein n=1 Tax=Streptomyces sp. NPDC091040 TaxID=3365972 RepID=UPI0038246E21
MTVSLDATNVRYMVMPGEDTDPARRGDKQLVAQSTCSMRVPTKDVFERTMKALFASDEALRSRPAEEKTYDWQAVYFTPEGDNGGGKLDFGVAWYDQPFFEQKGAAYVNAMHSKMFDTLGVPAESVLVQHWQPVPASA